MLPKLHSITAVLLACMFTSGCSNENLKEAGSKQSDILAISGPLESRKDFEEVFLNTYAQPFLGGPYYDLGRAVDVVITEGKTYVAVNSPQPSVHIYENGRYVKSYVSDSQGPEGVIQKIRALSVNQDGSLDVLDRDGLSIVQIGADFKVKRKINTGLFGIDFIKDGDHFLVYTGTQKNPNIGRLCRVNIDGELISEYLPIEDNRLYLNFLTKNHLYRTSTGKIRFQQKYYPNIYEIDGDALSIPYVLDFGSKEIPGEYFDRPHQDVREFIMPILQSDYSHGAGNFMESPDRIIFVYLQGSEKVLAIVDKRDEYASKQLVKRLHYNKMLGGTEITDHFEAGPLGVTEDGFFYWRILTPIVEEEQVRNIVQQPALQLGEEEQEKMLAQWDTEFRFMLIFGK
ncbi:6-bladed beta-propeller [Neolewinella lacunae]|uniref:6-bladed beta-propeller n=1 Tax=Neolewinella lacunae TaxID=1517758 RepID=A0A923T7I5_9BACT|nr:6-bladed beta-propeller [Neolewinella lacunae]MBC6994540.1 6-bladed beta-propeller [Neolewinella lacunae]MDN3634233.1 6-bladed beta-propeller [Neolewinella lacunae]